MTKKIHTLVVCETTPKKKIVIKQISHACKKQSHHRPGQAQRIPGS